MIRLAVRAIQGRKSGFTNAFLQPAACASLLHLGQIFYARFADHLWKEKYKVRLEMQGRQQWTRHSEN